MVIRSFLYVFFFSLPFLSQADPYKISAGIAKDLGSSKAGNTTELMFLLCAHEKQEDTRNADMVVRMLQEAEEKGEPFHVLIENISPLLRNLNKSKKDLLYELLPKYEAWQKSTGKKLNTVVEDIEIRKLSGIAAVMFTDMAPLSISMNLMRENNRLDESVRDYVKKGIKEINFQDVLDELDELLKMAHQARDLCAGNETPPVIETLYERLNDALTVSCATHMALLKRRINKIGLDLNKPLFNIRYPDCCELRNPLADLVNGLFDFYAIKRIAELQKLNTKKIILITGGTHCDRIISGLENANLYKQAFWMGREEPDINDIITPIYIQWAFRCNLYNHLLEMARRDDDEKLRQRRIACIVGLMACTAVVVSCKILYQIIKA